MTCIPALSYPWGNHRDALGPFPSKKEIGLGVYRENHPEGTTEVETWLPEGVTVRS